MKENKQNIHRHGEIIIKPINVIPSEAKLVKTGKDYIVGHSETGHHHVLELTQPKLSVYELDGETYLDVQQPGNLVHKKTGTDVHTSQVVETGKYKVIVKRQFDYFKNMITRVRD